MELSASQKNSFHQFIFTWWEKNKRDLPWRRTHDPYKILVSELMLQQTQVTRVLPKYEEFLSIFPDVFSLSQATVGDVLKAWKGMGYNRRALYLKKLAEVVSTKYAGVFPHDERLLLELPGLGRYTARAVMVFAFQLDVAMVDTNVRQIIVHHFFHDVPQKESVIQSVADQLVPAGKSWDWHQALMDYGSLALPKVSKSVRSSQSAKIPFRETKRFFRGRIVDYLREKSWDEPLLVKEMAVTYGKDELFHKEILKQLESEGLIERSKTGIISLPK